MEEINQAESSKEELNIMYSVEKKEMEGIDESSSLESERRHKREICQIMG
jgi:hypothetical protein